MKSASNSALTDGNHGTRPERKRRQHGLAVVRRWVGSGGNPAKMPLSFDCTIHHEERRRLPSEGMTYSSFSGANLSSPAFSLRLRSYHIDSIAPLREYISAGTLPSM